jgi:RNA polymerase sigma-70 factor, ECF subfamily
MGGTRLVGWLVGASERETVDWDVVYAEELPRVYNFFRYRIGDRATAEDLTSSTFEKAWRARGRYRQDRASVATWLLSIARNVAIDHFRRRRPEVALADADVGADAGAATPEEVLERRNDARRLAGLLANLAPRERDVLSLKYGADATNRAIAKVTGLSESNVGTILHRTIARLRAAWDEGGRS